MRNANGWFGNKPWIDLTKEDIQKVYDGLEDGRVKTQLGRPVEDRQSYYNKIFKSKPFRLAGKDGLAREVIEFSTWSKPEVRYVTEETFLRVVRIMKHPEHALLLWLAWDIGENIDSLLKLTKRDFLRQLNRHSGEPEYIVTLPAAKLKRSRQSRSEVTLYRITAELTDEVLGYLQPDDRLFTFGYRSAAKLLKNAVIQTNAVTMPNQQPVRWKDFRSGMACHLLRNGWTRDEVNARLGHTPNSDALNAYINFMALDREGPKQRLHAQGKSGSWSPPAAPAAVPPATGDVAEHSRWNAGRSMPLPSVTPEVNLTAASARAGSPVLSRPTTFFTPPTVSQTPQSELDHLRSQVAALTQMLSTALQYKGEVATLAKPSEPRNITSEMPVHPHDQHRSLPHQTGNRPDSSAALHPAAERERSGRLG